jgi:hypothetical protein
MTLPPATNSQQALANLQNTQSAAKSPEQLMQSANQQYGVDAAQQQVSGLRGAIAKTTGLLNQVAPSVYGRTQGSLVTNAQATRQIGNEQQPIRQDLSRLGEQYGQASGDLNTAEGRAQTQAQLAMTGQQGQLSYLQQLYGSLQDKEQKEAALAEQRREADLSAATSRASSASSPSYSLGGVSSLLRGGGGYNVAQDSSGGYQFTNGGKPITAYQYVTGNGGNWNDLMVLLSQSKNAGDQQIVRDMSGGLTQSQLMKKYPNVFGG